MFHGQTTHIYTPVSEGRSQTTPHCPLFSWKATVVTERESSIPHMCRARRNTSASRLTPAELKTCLFSSLESPSLPRNIRRRIMCPISSPLAPRREPVLPLTCHVGTKLCMVDPLSLICAELRGRLLLAVQSAVLGDGSWGSQARVILGENIDLRSKPAINLKC
jgi:hypothetical protein